MRRSRPSSAGPDSRGCRLLRARASRDMRFSMRGRVGGMSKSSPFSSKVMATVPRCEGRTL